MSTKIRPELSRKSKYYIEKHRAYELKHFCRQYPIWKKAREALDGLSGRPSDLAAISKSNEISDPTAKCAEARLFYSERMSMVEQTTIEADFELSKYILKAVTEGLSYEYFKARLEIPCCRDTYYESYRRFFWLLNKVRN